MGLEVVPPFTICTVLQLDKSGELLSSGEDRAILQAEYGQDTHDDMSAVGVQLHMRDVPFGEQFRDRRVKR